MDGPARTLVLGLDSVPPDLLFDRFLPVMPNMQALLRRSAYGTLRSCDPPITVPAWAVMFTGMDPGSLGIYGFRHRRAGSYFDTYTPTPQMIPYPPAWDLLSRRGKRVAIVGMPPGFPPPKVNGVYVSDFLTPSDSGNRFVEPASEAAEIQKVSGGYKFDVTFRAEDRERVAEEVFEMTRRRWAVARHLWQKEKWDLFALHEIGPDRIHHAFWKFWDTSHNRYEGGTSLAKVTEDYYRLMDEEIGKFLALVDDRVSVFVLSDHGSQGMDGCFCINEWLIREGYLALKDPKVKPGTPIEKANVDWSRTRAWGAGGYYARIFFNVRGREPNGVIRADEVARLTTEIEEKLKGVTRPDGRPLAPDLRAPNRIYRQVRGDAPDLMVYFGNLRWRSAGTLGYGRDFIEENDTGPDDAVHSFEGVFAVRDAQHSEARRLGPFSLQDIGPTILRRMGAEIPAEVQGRPIDALL